MTDEELLLATSKARGVAHRAEFSEYSMDHRGHTSIVTHKSSWAMRGNEFSALMGECQRRGLKMPDCDCPPGSHDQKLRIVEDGK